MKYRPLGQSGIEASVVALGAWAIGGWNWGGTEENESINAIHAAIDEGINFIDTAPVYGFGRSEEIVGQAIAGRRDKVVLATKCGLIWDRQEGEFHFRSDEKTINTDKPTLEVYKCLRPKSIRKEVETSLKLLKTDYIDLYQTHWQENTTPIADTMGCLIELKQEGKIRAIGVSNATPEQIDKYAQVGPVDTDQEKYNMLDNELEMKNLAHCRWNHIALLAYSPICQGLLTGKIGPDRKFADTDMRNKNPRYSVENRQSVANLLKEFQPLAEQHNLSMAQLAIAWTIAQPGVTHALVGARTPRQAQENAIAGKINLSEQDVANMDLTLARFSGEII